MNSAAWLGGSAGPVAVAAAAAAYGMGAAISASSVVYLIVGLMLVGGIQRYMRAELKKEG
jgi:hypothetical protein